MRATANRDLRATTSGKSTCSSARMPGWRCASPPRPGRDCAARILRRVARLAYRRPASPADVQTLLPFFADGRREGGSFDAGIQLALERVLVDPDFLLRVHRDPPSLRTERGASAGQAPPS